jgi:pimeloyl-ACP methyl ester carboxylesterase
MSRPLVVLLPALGKDRGMYEPLARALGDRADVVGLDLPDAGDARSVRLEDVARDLALRIAAEKGERELAILGGLSLGGTLAMMISAELTPRALLLVAPGGLRVASARKRAIAGAMEESDAPAGLRALLHAALDVDLEAQLAANEIPTDLVWGEDDRVFPARTRERYATLLRASELHLLAGIGHLVPLEAPSELAHIVETRLARIARDPKR